MRTRTHDAHGFTMVELLVVVMILGILVAIAVPTFVGARRSADDRAAETIVRHSLIAARAAWQEGAADVASLTANEPQLRYVNPDQVAEAGRQQVSVGSGTSGGDGWVILTSLSRSGACFALLDEEHGPVGYQRVATPACKADAFDPSSGWSDSWP